MKLFCLVLSMCCLMLGFAISVAARGPLDSVDPRWGAGMDQLLKNQTSVAAHSPKTPNLHSVGDMYPAIALPRPMTLWSPQTHTGYWFYNNLDKTFQGFRATHEAHPWVGDYGQFTIMPEVGRVETDPAKRASPFSHKQEFAHPYSYRVYLPRYHVWAQVAPTKRCAIFKFTFPKTRLARIVISARNATVTDGQLDHQPVVIGHIRSNLGGEPPNFACRFVAQSNPPPVSVKLFSAHGKVVGVTLTFNALQTPIVRMRVGTSFISVAQAELNMRQELPDWSIREVAAKAKTIWNRELARIELGDATPAQKRIFYTGLYEVLLYPHSFYEINADGRRIHYSPADGKVYPGRLYTGDGFWDTFRAAFPLMTLLYPEAEGRIIRGFLNFYKEGGWLPTWPSPGYEKCMVGTDVDAVIAQAYLQGIKGFDPKLAYAAIRKDGTVQPARPGYGYGIADLNQYLKLGYLPANVTSEATSTTLEEAYDDYCIAEMAKALGKTADYQMFRKLAFNYRHVFDPAVKFPWGRNADGSWQPHFDPLWWGSPFTEDDAWTYVWAVMQDPYGLISLLGGRAAALKRLDTYFTAPSDFHIGAYANWGHPIPEQIEFKILSMGLYGPNNEPSSHIAFFYDYLRQPWKAQYWVRQTLARVYNANGMVGDDDEGQMSAWYIFNVAGFYPFAPIRPFYLIGSPAVERVTFHLENGKAFTVRSIHNGPDDVYIQSATLNGHPFNQLWIDQKTIREGGQLVFHMGATPNKHWASNQAAMPPAGNMTQP